MSTISPQDHPFFVLSEAIPDSHPASISPFFIRTIEKATKTPLSPQPLNTRNISKPDPSLSTSIAGVVISSALSIAQIFLQAKGNQIASATLQLTQVVGRGQHASHVVNAISAGGIAAATTVANAASSNVVNGISTLQQQGNNSTASFFSALSNLGSLNPFHQNPSLDANIGEANNLENPLDTRDVTQLEDGRVKLFTTLADGSIHIIMIFDGSLFSDVSAWAHDDLVRRACELAEEVFGIGSTVGSDDGESEDMLNILDAIPVDENPWEEEGSDQMVDDLYEGDAAQL